MDPVFAVPISDSQLVKSYPSFCSLYTQFELKEDCVVKLEIVEVNRKPRMRLLFGKCSRFSVERSARCCPLSSLCSQPSISHLK